MLKVLLVRLYDYIRFLITPPYCHGCSLFLREHSLFCDDCWKTVQPVAPTVIPLTLKKTISVHAAGVYEFPLKKLILAKNNQSIAASAMLGHVVCRQTPLTMLEFDYIVPIPLHWTRQCWRGYNQAEEMGRIMCNFADKQMLKALKRVKRTVFQAECNKQQRQKNIDGAFELAIDAATIKDKTILLVDDLLTTGTTITQAARLLYKAGAKDVIGIVGCKAV